MTTLDQLNHWRHTLEVYQGRLDDKEENNFYAKTHGYRNATNRREQLKRQIKNCRERIEELEEQLEKEKSITV